MAEGLAFVSSHSPVNNFPRDNLTDKEGYRYGGGPQYCSSSGACHRPCAPNSSLLGGMPTEGLPQSPKDVYTGWDDIVGKISTGGFFLHVFYVIFTSRVTHPLHIDRAQRKSRFLSK